MRIYTVQAADEIQEILTKDKDAGERAEDLLGEDLRQEVGDAFDALFGDSDW